MTVDRERCLRFLFDRSIPISIRETLLKKLKNLDRNIKTFDDLHFKPHPYRKLEVLRDAEEAHLNFINGFGVNVIRNAGGDYKYYVLRITRNGGEVKDKDNLNNLRHWDKACNTEEEVTKIMKQMQKRYCSYKGITAVISAINYLQTYREEK